jgi:hypothetical protein
MKSEAKNHKQTTVLTNDDKGETALTRRTTVAIAGFIEAVLNGCHPTPG